LCLPVFPKFILPSLLTVAAPQSVRHRLHQPVVVLEELLPVVCDEWHHGIVNVATHASQCLVTGLRILFCFRSFEALELALALLLLTQLRLALDRSYPCALILPVH
jgi:hypothetical protein